MQVGPAQGGQTSTTSTTDNPWQALDVASTAAGLDPTDVDAVARGMGISPHDMLSKLGKLSAASSAAPGATLGQLAVTAFGASPGQSAKINKEQGVQQGGTAGQTGAFTDIFGDLLESFYPFLMFGIAGVLFLLGLAIGLVAIVKNPTVQSVAGVGAGLATKV